MAVSSTTLIDAAETVESHALLEYRVKAAFLYNFAKFVDWPDDRPDDRRVMRICVTGDGEFAKVLGETVAGKSVHGRDISVQHELEGESDIGRCDVLYVGDSPDRQLETLLQPLGPSPVLTVGNAEDFVQRGGVINFYTERNKLRFEINPDAADRAGLRISSKLLGLARIVRDP